MINQGLENVLNDAADTIGSGDDFVDGIVHFARKNKTEEEKTKIDETGEDFKAAAKIFKGGLNWIAMGLGLAVTVKYLAKK